MPQEEKMLSTWKEKWLFYLPLQMEDLCFYFMLTQAQSEMKYTVQRELTFTMFLELFWKEFILGYRLLFFFCLSHVIQDPQASPPTRVYSLLHCSGLWIQAMLSAIMTLWCICSFCLVTPLRQNSTNVVDSPIKFRKKYQEGVKKTGEKGRRKGIHSKPKKYILAN